MELIDQYTKRIMEGCKERAREAGLQFDDQTLEYVVSNRDLTELGPKLMIPTLYDYWVHDVEVLKEKRKYEVYPTNAYETVINTRPAISFYNDNNPDWLNVMIFYHVIAHIDFFQNNILFKHTWGKDFCGQALSDKRLIARLRSEKGRWVDYAIEFSRSIDNLVGFYRELAELNYPPEIDSSIKLDYYFDRFLQGVKSVNTSQYIKEIERYNETARNFGDIAEAVFFSDVVKKYPEFEALFEKQKRKNTGKPKDILQFLQENSPFLQKEENKWIKSIMQIVRNTSLFFQPQIRSKIMNEGWATYWHERLFLEDERIKGHEVDFARVNSKVASLPRVGLNPYALGMRLFAYIESLAEKGKISHEFKKIRDLKTRREYNRKTGKGLEFIFQVRENLGDFLFINIFLDQDFVDKNNLFVSGKRLNRDKGVWEYYVRSRACSQYKEMLLNSLYHPPHIEIDVKEGSEECLYLKHHFEQRPLVKEYIPNTLMGIEYLWGGTVKLETTEMIGNDKEVNPMAFYNPFYGKEKPEPSEDGPKYRRVLYTMENKKLKRRVL